MSLFLLGFAKAHKDFNVLMSTLAVLAQFDSCTDKYTIYDAQILRDVINEAGEKNLWAGYLNYVKVFFYVFYAISFAAHMLIRKKR